MISTKVLHTYLPILITDIILVKYLKALHYKNTHKVDKLHFTLTVTIGLTSRQATTTPRNCDCMVKNVIFQRRFFVVGSPVNITYSIIQAAVREVCEQLCSAAPCSAQDHSRNAKGRVPRLCNK